MSGCVQYQFVRGEEGEIDLGEDDFRFKCSEAKVLLENLNRDLYMHSHNYVHSNFQKLMNSYHQTLKHEFLCAKIFCPMCHSNC